MTGPERGARPAKVLPARLPAAGRMRGSGPQWMSAGMPAEKAMRFGPSAKRLIGRLSPYRPQLSLVIGLALVSVTLAVTGPKILGRATDIIFAGVIGKRIPPGLTLDQAVEQARRTGNGRFADLLARMDVVPGMGVDFSRLARVLVLALAVYVCASVLAWLQGYALTGVVQRMIRWWSRSGSPSVRRSSSSRSGCTPAR